MPQKESFSHFTIENKIHIFPQMNYNITLNVILPILLIYFSFWNLRRT